MHDNFMIYCYIGIKAKQNDMHGFYYSWLVKKTNVARGTLGT